MGFAVPTGKKHFPGTLRETESDPHTPAAEPRVSQRLLFPLTLLVSAKSPNEVGLPTNSAKQRDDLFRDKPQSHATLSTATRGARTARSRAPLSAANTSLVSFGSGSFPKHPGLPTVDIFVGYALDTLLRTMSQTVNNFSMSSHFPISSRGPAQCAVHCAANELGSWVTEYLTVRRETQPSLAPQQPREPRSSAPGAEVHRLQEPLCPGEAVSLPAPPALAVGGEAGQEDRATGLQGCRARIRSGPVRVPTLGSSRGAPRNEQPPQPLGSTAPGEMGEGSQSDPPRGCHYLSFSEMSLPQW